MFIGGICQLLLNFPGGPLISGTYSSLYKCAERQTIKQTGLRAWEPVVMWLLNLRLLTLDLLWEASEKSLSLFWFFVTSWTVSCQAPLSTGFSRQEYWSGWPFPSPGDLLNTGIEPGSPPLGSFFTIWATREASWEASILLISPGFIQVNQNQLLLLMANNPDKDVSFCKWAEVSQGSFSALKSPVWPRTEL